MAFLADAVFDNGLSTLNTAVTRLDICSQEPATYGAATTAGTYSLGNKTSLSVGAPGDRSGGGRKVTVPAISDGSVTTTGTASHWALTNGTDTLYATGALSASQGVTSGNTFTLTTFDIGIPDPA